MTWRIQTSPSASSYITKLEIYLNNTLWGTVLRGSLFQFDIGSLKPYTGYTVGIEAVDGYSQKSGITEKIFTTKEAGNCELSES